MTAIKRTQFGEREKQLLIGVSIACGMLFIVVVWLGWYVFEVRRNSTPILTDEKATAVINNSGNQKIEAKTEAERGSSVEMLVSASR